MIENNFIIVSLISIFIWIIFRISIIMKNKKVNICREIVLLLFYIYFLWLLLLTIFKGGFITLRNPFKEYMYNEYGLIGIINIVPIKETIVTFMHSEAGAMNSMRNVIGNIIAFVPLGFFISLLFEKFNNYKKVLKVGFLSSLAIEITQLFVGYNVCDIDDIIYNTLGALVGFICFKTFEMITSKINLKEKIDKIRDFETNNIFKKVIKGILIVSVVILISYMYAFYDQTMPSNLNDKDMAKEAFNCNIDDVLQIKEFNENKFYLIRNEFGVEVKQINKFVMDRYVDSRMGYSYIENNKYGYREEWIYENVNSANEDNKMSPIIYGKNKNADKILINIKGEKFEQKINKNDYFMVIYPEMISFNEIELNQIYSDESNENIMSIKFLDDNGKEISTINNLDEIEG